MLGNTVKLPGLVQYLSKHLGYDVLEIDSFNKLGGASVVAAPSFKDNVLAFSTCYGLCLQGLGKAQALDESLAARNPHAAADSRQKAVGHRRRQRDAAGLCPQLRASGTDRWWQVNPEWAMQGVKWSRCDRKPKK